LLVRAGGQGIVVPFSQVKRIYYHKQETGEVYPQDAPFAGTPAIYHLNTLLGFSTGNDPAGKIFQTIVIPELDDSQIVVEVDEVVGEIELVMKSLPAHLRRPGIAAAALDGGGNVLLVANLAQIIQLKQHGGSAVIETTTLNERMTAPPQPTTNQRQKILIADDSVYIRRSISLSLSREGYDVLEAVDGIQTLELLSKEAPNLLLLDIEMPNLNGYGVLNFIRVQQRFPELKIVMLTSRSSEKHKQRAHALGAHSYLTKPCPQDVLLETVQELLAPGGES